MTLAAIEHPTDYLRALPGDDVRQILWRFADRSTLAAGSWLAVRRVLHAPRLRHAQGLVEGIIGLPRRRGERRRARRRPA